MPFACTLVMAPKATVDGRMALFRKRSGEPDEVARLRAEVSEFAERLAAADARRAADDERRQQTWVSPAEPSPIAQVADVDTLRADVFARLDALDARLEAVDGRITSIPTELPPQLDELGAEQAGAADHHDTITALQTAQTRLANEQARYQIAFRDDLAALAERLRRP